MSEHTKKHTVIYDKGQPAFVVVPIADYQEWQDANTYIPHEVVKLQAKHGCNLLGAWRRYRNLTQKTFAEKMGVKQQAVSQMEQVDNSRNSTLERAATLLNCDIAQLTD